MSILDKWPNSKPVGGDKRFSAIGKWQEQEFRNHEKAFDKNS